MKNFPIVGIIAYFGSIVAYLLISDRLGDRVSIGWFSIWSLGLGLLSQVIIASKRQELSIGSTSRKRLVLAGLGIVTFTAWIAIVAVVGALLGLYTTQVLNLTGILAWAMGVAAAMILARGAGHLTGKLKRGEVL